MKPLLRTRRERGTYTVTDAQRPKSEDIAYRQRRYLISMGIRVVAFLLAVFLFHGVWRFVAAGIALVVPYFAVVFANGGREPADGVRFETFRPRLPTPPDNGRESLSSAGPRTAMDNGAPPEDAPDQEPAEADSTPNSRQVDPQPRPAYRHADPDHHAAAGHHTDPGHPR